MSEADILSDVVILSEAKNLNILGCPGQLTFK